jgi:hypothetical protein
MGAHELGKIAAHSFRDFQVWSMADAVIEE